jgi:hypothetical protein
MNTLQQIARESVSSASILVKPMTVGGLTTNLYAQGFRLYHKRVTFLARRMPEAFAVYTPEGMQQGVANDYILLNLAGECWPIPARLFEQTYKWT